MKENLNQIKIVFIGNSCLISGHRISKELQKRMEGVAQVLGTSLELALLDADFFRILNEPDLNSVNDLNNVFSYFGLLLDELASVEVWVNRKRRKTIKVVMVNQTDFLFTDANEDRYSLFPKYNLSIEHCDIDKLKHNITFVERSIGGVMTFTSQIQNLDLYKFVWRGGDICSNHISRILILSNITYDGGELRATKSDNLVRSRSILLDLEQTF